MSSSPIFAPFKMRPITLSNRIIRSATWENLSPDNGMPSKKLLKMIEELAIGKTGLIIPGYLYTIPHGQSVPNQSALLSEEHALSWKDTISMCHKEGSKIIFQINHGGVKCPQELIHCQPRGVSANIPGSREMSPWEIAEVIESFARAAKLLQEVGADGVQIHCAHGFLLSQFLSPAWNERHDEYGGSPGRRTRAVAEAIEAVRSATTKEFAVGLKVNGFDYVEGGLTPELAGRQLAVLPPVDFIEVSSGGGPGKNYNILSDVDHGLIKRKCGKRADEISKRAEALYGGLEYHDLFNLDAAAAIRRLVDAPVATVGGVRKLKDMEEALRRGQADLFSMSRPFLRQPHLVRDLMSGAAEVKCNSCGLCTLNRVVPIHCQNF